ncbi:MAG: leucine-rich repeat domain-containing protein [Kiritimatiellae bacterium]|nr:leucine-rich repeat domain-containing protein [Kiritimatiellia bacterium]
MHSTVRYIPAIALCFAVAGCFDEPAPAYKTVPEGARVYLQGRGFADFASARAGLDPALVDYLNLDRNALTNVDGIADFTHLRWLRLNGNRLSALPPLAALSSLQRVYLADNAFAEVPGELAELPALTSIDLSGNPLSRVPEWLAKKGNLEFLSLSRTRVEKLPDDLSAWRGLKMLQLGDLKLPPGEMARIRESLLDVAIVF